MNLEEQYSIADFMRRMKGKSLLEVMEAADSTAGRVESASYSVKGATKRREQGSMDYVRDLKALLWFLRTGTRPLSISEWEWQSYLPIAKQFVEQGEWKPEILKLFERPQKP